MLSMFYFPEKIEAIDKLWIVRNGEAFLCKSKEVGDARFSLCGG